MSTTIFLSNEVVYGDFGIFEVQVFSSHDVTTLGVPYIPHDANYECNVIIPHRRIFPLRVFVKNILSAFLAGRLGLATCGIRHG